MATPDTPYTGMPALRRYRPSVAPVSMDGTTGAPGKNVALTCSIGPMTSGTSGEGGDGLAGFTTLSATAVSLIARRTAATTSS